MATAGFNSSSKVRARLQAALYYNRKRRVARLNPTFPPTPPDGNSFSADYFAEQYTE